jgi:hypothetical protein
MLNLRTFESQENKIQNLKSELEDLGFYDPLKTWILDVQTESSEDVIAEGFNRILFLCVATSPAEAAGQIFDYYREDLIQDYLEPGENQKILDAIESGKFDFGQVVKLLNRENDSRDVSDSSSFEIIGIYELGINTVSRKKHFETLVVYDNLVGLNEIGNYLQTANKILTPWTGKKLEDLKPFFKKN